MLTKKKIVKPKKEEGKEAPMVTQVVEVVDEASGETKPIEDTIKKEEVKEVVDELKEEVVDVQEKVSELEQKVEPVAAEAPKEKDKAVIEEIFGNNQSGVMPEISGKENGSSKSLIVWALVVIAVAIVTGLGLLVAVRGPESVTSMFVTPTPTPTLAPTPTPTPVAPNRADITVEVLNGSGVAGAASKLREFLEGKGYTVGHAGNATTSDYKKTEIHVKKDKEQYLSLLKNDIAEGYTVSSAAADLSDNSSYGAQVIVGKE
ncbi:hypothetical protein A2875_01230 [Candidatus Gottesmanbacteria bacterium RIFCSPHIGHO2_01_FULL_46_14]|uniref:LytR/CpsA/Psr regulator C-terminal domain-containing protein n=2 Tax=Candidatus Gottesmaniibacteriota TaxID=1752720 RepID=A0A1F5ZPU3_9BACT|nr:MAG: hypothetical protein A2875_01230 [Candidatus Gottesmanbacteria bacterium RIFCSPHIGHO2_01_FULL_46_14]OGG30284.1 MAG: hypothetical protein A2971_00415 [Candidatus Gottesmanbacteria bacterium RIFCSPLOWO2_01_FULL_46_21]